MSNTLLDLSNAMSDATEKAGRSVVLVNARRRLPASGIAFAADLIVTADHVVQRDEDITVVLADGSEVAAKVAGRDPGSDLAVLRLEKSVATPAEKAASARVGQIVLALGRPSLDGIEASLGTISAVGGPVRTPRGMLVGTYRTDTTAYPGFSGGPLIDAEGHILGLNTSGFGRGSLVTIPAEIVWKVAEQLAAHGSIKRGFLGIRSQPVELTAAAQKSLQREQGSGLLLIGLEGESPAEKAGLLVGDILVGLNGHPVSDSDELYASLSGDVVGKPTPVQVLRGGEPKTISVTVGER
jgi:S1-C subfamily serine protease